MSNTEDELYKNVLNSVTYVGKTIRDTDNNSTALIIPTEFAKELDIENSNVIISILNDFYGKRHLLVSKYSREILIN